MLEKIKKNKLFIFAVIPLLTIITIITTKIIIGKELIVDKIAHHILINQLRFDEMTVIMKNITKLGNTKTIIMLAIILILLFLFKIKRKNISIIITCNLIISSLTNQILKAIFQRPRPIGYRLINITGYSFPSGHAMVSMAFYGLLIYIIYHLVKNKKLRNILIIIISLIILLIGLSRVYLGVHYMSDVIVGYSVSIIYLLLIPKILKKYKLFP